MFGVRSGRQDRSCARILALTATSTILAAMPGGAFAPSSAHAQNIFSFAPVTSPQQPSAAQSASPVQNAAAARRSVHRRHDRRGRFSEQARAAARGAGWDPAKDGQYGALGARVNDSAIAILTGGLDATSTAMAADLSSVLGDSDHLRVLPVLGKGAGQTLRDVRYLKGVELGITHANLLNAFKHDGELGALDERIVYLARLFDEEMHVLVRSDSAIGTLAELAGQRVNFGAPDSGAELISRDLFTRLDVKAVEVNLGQAEALQKLRKGEIAATVVIAGKPAAAISQLTAGGFRLLPVPYGKDLQSDYLPASLGPQDYPSLIGPLHPVDTVAVPAVLIAYNWPKGSDRYRRLEAFVEAFFPRLAELQAPPRHPKWREANLAATLPGWKRFEPAEDWLARARPQARDERGSREKFTATMDVLTGSGATAPEADHLFQEFLKWRQERERQ